MPEFDVKLERVLYADVTIVAEDADAALEIAGSADYQLPPMSQWSVHKGGEITVQDEDGDIAAHGYWSIARIIPDDETEDEEENAEVLEIAAGEFRIMLFSENTVLWLTGMTSYDLEAAGEIIIPAADPALTGELPLLVRARDGSEYPAHVERSALEGKTWIVLDEES
jgi:hypothetical protein